MVGKTDGVKSVSLSVMEGDPFTLHTDFEIHQDALMLWRFGDKGILLAKIDFETNETSLNDADEGFSDRLQLDQTGSLTIKNTRTTDSGLYEVQIKGSESLQTFLVSVVVSNSTPIITIYVIFSIYLKQFQIITLIDSFSVSLYTCPRCRSFFKCYSRNSCWCYYSSADPYCLCDLLSPQDL